jgi:hypothetical protein
MAHMTTPLQADQDPRTFDRLVEVYVKRKAQVLDSSARPDVPIVALTHLVDSLLGMLMYHRNHELQNSKYVPDMLKALSKTDAKLGTKTNPKEGKKKNKKQPKAAPDSLPSFQDLWASDEESEEDDAPYDTQALEKEVQAVLEKHGVKPEKAEKVRADFDRVLAEAVTRTKTFYTHVSTTREKHLELKVEEIKKENHKLQSRLAELEHALREQDKKTATLHLSEVENNGVPKKPLDSKPFPQGS